MDFFNYFRNFFGFSGKPPGGREDGLRGEKPNDFRNPIWSTDEDDDDDFRSQPRHHFRFSVDSDPFEMHRFFEQQFDEILRSFQSFGFGGFGHKQILPERSEQEKEVWEHYLKPGYDRNDHLRGEKQDSDLDGKVFADELDKFFKVEPPVKKPQDRSLAVINPDDYLTKPGDFLYKGDRSLKKPEEFLAKPNISSRMFGQSVVSKTVRRPDGAVEHHRTLKDSQGNEETTITRQIGEQSYSVTTKTKANGEQEYIKNFINVDEDHLDDFEKKWGSKL